MEPLPQEALASSPTGDEDPELRAWVAAAELYRRSAGLGIGELRRLFERVLAALSRPSHEQSPRDLSAAVGLFQRLAPGLSGVVFAGGTAPEEAVTHAAPSGPTPMTPHLLFNRLQTVARTAFALVDVRPTDAFVRGHILQAVNLSPDGLDGFVRTLRAGDQVVLYGEYGESGPVDGAWPMELGRALLRRGVEVFTLDGGYSAFAARYPFACTAATAADSKTYFSEGQAFPTEVVEGFLYLGDRHQAADGQVLAALGMTHVINATHDVPELFPETLNYLRIPLEDTDDEALYPHLAGAVAHLERLAQTPGARVLVHCRLGLSRSAAVVLAYLMASRRMSFDDALIYLRAHRPWVSPNRSFREQLARYQAELGLATSPPRPPAPPWEAPPLPAYLDPERLPRHIGVIMDGNRRWATERRRRSMDGHLVAQETVERLIRVAGKWGIRYCSLYAFSTENWSRPEREVRAIFDVLEITLIRSRERFKEDGVRIQVAGDLDDPRIPTSLRLLFRAVMQDTAHCDGLILTIAVNYGGRQSLVSAVRRLHRLGRNSGDDGSPDGSPSVSLDERSITEALLDEFPGGELDLLVRTSGELRTSNFAIWEASYAELYFTDANFPDFDVADLGLALLDYQERGRRFGR